MSTENQQIGERMRAFIYDAYGSVLGATMVTGVREVSWYRYFRGENAPSSDVYLKLAQLGCNMTWLFLGEGEMYLSNETGKKLKKQASERKRSELRQQ